MRRGRVLLAAVVLSLAAAPGGAVAPTGAIAPDERVAELAVVDAVLAGDLREAMLSALEALGGDRLLVEALADGAEGEQLLAAPDLDGDGLPDVIGLGRESRPGQSAVAVAEELTVTARSGISGEPLWTASVPGTTGILVADSDGPLLVTMEDSLAALSLHLTAFDPDGTVRWRRSDTGVTAGFAFIGLPLYRGSLDAPDGSTRHLVALWDLAFIDQTRTPSRITAHVLESADGSDAGPVVASSDNDVTWAHPLADLTGDGAGEVAITRAQAFGTSGTIAAHRVDGTEVWAAEAPFRSNGYLEVAPDATGDGVPDIAIGAGVGRVALLAGADGTTAWERDGGWPAALGDVTGDGRTDIGVRSLGVEVSGGYRFVADHAAYDGAGAQLYHTTRTVDFADYAGGFSSTTTTWLVGADLDGDGIRDTFHDFHVTENEGPRSIRDAGPVSGATGELLWNTGQGWPDNLLGAGVHGAGEDLARIRGAGGGARVDVIRGDDGAQAWQARLDGLGTFHAGSAVAADLDGDGHAEVLVTVVTDDGSILTQHGRVLDGADGTPRWTATP